MESLANEDDPEREEYLDWLGGVFNPEEFDLAEVNVRLAR